MDASSSSDDAPATWEEWATRHARLFGLRQPGDGEMVVEWARLFALNGYTPEDAWGASQAMAMDAPPASTFRDAHFLALRASLRAFRPHGQGGGRPKEPEPSRCPLCGDTGRVLVPHVEPEHWRPGRRLTCYVLCDQCPLGRWYQQGLRDHPKGPFDAIGRYELRNPDWQGQLEQKAAEELAQAKARASAGRQDRLFGPALAQALLRSRTTSQQG